MLAITLKGLLARKLRLLATSLAVLLGVSFMSGTMVLTDTIQRTFDRLFADVYAGTDAMVRAKSALEHDDSERPRLDVSLVDEVRQVPGVDFAEGQLQGYAQIVGANGKPLGTPDNGAPTFGGNWSGNSSLNPFTVAEGRPPARPGEIVLDRKSLHDGGFHLGDVATVLTRNGSGRFTIVGATRFGTADSAGGASYVLWTPVEAQTLLAAPGKVDSIGVVAASGVSQHELRARLAQALPRSVEVVTGAQLTAENQNDIKQGLKFFGAFLLTFALVSLFVGSFIISNTFSIVVAQRTREMALLRAVGASRRQVLTSVLVEAAVLGLVASAVGLVAGIAFAGVLKALLAGFGLEVPAGGIVVTGRTVVTTFVVGLGVTIGAAFLPARRAARIAPVEAMRAVDVDTTGTSRVRIVAGIAITGVGSGSLLAGLLGGGSGSGRFPLIGLGCLLVFVGVAVLGPVLARPVVRVLSAPLPRLRGTTGALAGANAARNPRRTASTAAALMVGVGLVSFITIFGASGKASIDKTLHDSFRGDFVLSGSWSGGIPTEVTGRVQRLPEVERAVAVRMTPVEIGGRGHMLTAADPRALAAMYDLDVSRGSMGDLGPGGIAIASTTATERHLQVGDTVSVTFPETGPQQLRVVAVYGNRDVAGSWLVDLRTHVANVTTPVDSLVFVDKAPGTTAAEARAAVDRVLRPFPTVHLRDLTEFKEAQGKDIDTMLGLIYALLGLAVLIALLGIANTLALSIFERTRELGLLRAVGMTQPQLRSTIRWEAVIIALFGTVLGLGVGTFFGWTMVRALADQGFSSFALPVGRLAVVTVIAGVAGVVAAIVPARRAARLDVLAAIAVA